MTPKLTVRTKLPTLSAQAKRLDKANARIAADMKSFDGHLKSVLKNTNALNMAGLEGEVARVPVKIHIDGKLYSALVLARTKERTLHFHGELGPGYNPELSRSFSAVVGHVDATKTPTDEMQGALKSVLHQLGEKLAGNRSAEHPKGPATIEAAGRRVAREVERLEKMVDLNRLEMSKFDRELNEISSRPDLLDRAGISDNRYDPPFAETPVKVRVLDNDYSHLTMRRSSTTGGVLVAGRVGLPHYETFSQGSATVTGLVDPSTVSPPELKTALRSLRDQLTVKLAAAR